VWDAIAQDEVLELYVKARRASMRRSADNPMQNPFFSTLVKGALKALKVVAFATFAYEVAVAVQILEKFVQDREREAEQDQKSIGFY
jgi:hypothetical protein